MISQCFTHSSSTERLLFVFFCLILSRKGWSFCLYLSQMVVMSVAMIWPMSAITDKVKGIPTMANKIQNSLPGVVTGAKWPYPMVVRMVMTKKMAWL